MQESRPSVGARGRLLLGHVTRPMRKALGRLVISRAEDRLATLETAMAQDRLQSLLMYKCGAFIAADKIEGDYLEFGVFSGGSFIQAYHAMQAAFTQASTPSIWNTDQDCAERRRLWSRMRFFAFDSFEGLPPPTGIDAMSSDFAAGKFASSQAEFEERIARGGVPMDRVTTVPGWYEDTLTQETIAGTGLNKAAVVLVDCDLYESARRVLEFITPLLVDGTIVIFDDWYNFRGHPDLGEQRACREWLAAHPEWNLNAYQKEGPWRNSFVANRVDAHSPAARPVETDG